ncbi:hypothetical protein OAM04_02480 [bacterium]|nr:hypothetical protein [Verrucomicrobiales bacterium]MDC0312068.1 hypothetical protein [bacterium]
MKIPFFFIAVLTAVAAFGFSASVQANPPAKQQVIAQAPQAPQAPQAANEAAAK